MKMTGRSGPVRGQNSAAHLSVTAHLRSPGERECHPGLYVIAKQWKIPGLPCSTKRVNAEVLILVSGQKNRGGAGGPRPEAG